MQDYLIDLNESQLSAVKDITGPSLIIAGAGSGKTRVLTYRIAHLLRLGRHPATILSLTFTNKAAREMKERIAKIVGAQVASSLWMGTFHSIFARILRMESAAFDYPASFTIYDQLDSRNIIKSIIKDFKLNDERYKPNEVQSRISYAKNNLVTAAAYMQTPAFYQIDISSNRPEIARIYAEYDSRCKRANSMDFDDLLLNTTLLFSKHPEILQKYQRRFEYVLVDEYQDTNLVQYVIVKKLAEQHKNICVVGDDSQSIYAFRGARIENILNFQKDYPENRLYKLEQNYRSTRNIVDAANSIIDQNKNKIPKTVWSANEAGDKIKVLESYTDREEGAIVCNLIKDIQLQELCEYRDFAILYRTHAQSRVFEESLRKRNIPYKIYGGLSFYQRKEIKDLLAYYKLVVNPKDDEAFRRIINYPRRGIGDTTVNRIEQVANHYKVSFWDVCLKLRQMNLPINQPTMQRIDEFIAMINRFAEKIADYDAYDMAYEIAKESGVLKDLYAESQEAEGLSRYQNVQELLNGIKQLTAISKTEGSPLTLDVFLQEVALMTNDDNDNEDDKNKVVMMTVHSSKGLEFKNVFLVGIEEGLFPSEMSSGSSKELEEERRLFYVAVTRAQKRVVISYSKSRLRWGEFVTAKPSRFIREINTDFIDNDLQVESQFHYESFDDAAPPKKDTHTQSYRQQQPQFKTPIGKTGQKLTSINQAQKQPTPRYDFSTDDNSRVVEGARVVHERFGEGVVVKLEGALPNAKATIKFDSEGQRVLLLKFAKLKLIG